MEAVRPCEATDISGSHRIDALSEFLGIGYSGHGAVNAALGGCAVTVSGLGPVGVGVALALNHYGCGTIRLIDQQRVQAQDISPFGLLPSTALSQKRAEAVAELISGDSKTPTIVECRTEANIEDEALAGGTLIAFIDERDTRQVALQALTQGTPVLHLQVKGKTVMLGFLKNEGGVCWSCAESRYRSQRDPSDWWSQAPDGAGHLSAPVLRPGTYASGVGRLAAAMLSLWTADDISSLPADKIAELDLERLRLRFAALLPVPACPVCRVIPGRGQQYRQGTRALSAVVGQPVNEVRPTSDLIDERVGVIGWIHLRPAAADEPQSLVEGAAESGFVTGRPSAVSRAKGNAREATADGAALIALAEAVERYCASQAPEHTMFCSCSELPGAWIDPAQLVLYASWQYLLPNFHYLPYTEERRIHWVLGSWLDDDSPVWVPASMTYLRFDERTGERLVQSTSSGLAAGVTIGDARLRAVLELIERDAFMTMWILRKAPQALRLPSHVPENVATVMAEALALGLALKTYLIPSLTGLPVVMCLGSCNTGDWPAISVGLGCDWSAERALSKAVFEAVKNACIIRRRVRRGVMVPAHPMDVRTFSDHGMYYADHSRASALDFVQNVGGESSLPDGHFDRQHFGGWLTAEATKGRRYAVVEVTSKDVAQTPWRVVRALAPGFQPLHCGHLLERLASPAFVAESLKDINLTPHPLA